MGQHRQSSAALCPNAPSAALRPPAIALNTTVKSEIAAAKRLHTYAQLQIMPHTAAAHGTTLAAHGSTQPKRTCNGSAPICNRTKQNGKVLKWSCKMAPHPHTATKHHSNSGCAYGSIGNPRSAKARTAETHCIVRRQLQKETRASFGEGYSLRRPYHGRLQPAE